MNDVSSLLSEIVAHLEQAKPNPTLWSSAAARALEAQICKLQTELHSLQHNLLVLPRISL